MLVKAFYPGEKLILDLPDGQQIVLVPGADPVARGRRGIGVRIAMILPSAVRVRVEEDLNRPSFVRENVNG